MGLLVIGLNHRTAPVDLRERVATPASHVPHLISALKRECGFSEAAVLSTCNRFEIYGVAKGGLEPRKVLGVVCAAQGREAPESVLDKLEPSLYVRQELDCAHHLFRVASSLDSLMVGETEIVGQVKEAYEVARRSGGPGKILHRLFQTAFSVSKAVRNRSGIGRCSTSVGSVSVDLAEQIFGEDLEQRRVLVIGAGKISGTTVRHLAKRGARSILVCNRSLTRAEAVASEFGGEAVPFECLPQALAKADIVISSTSAPGYVLRRGTVSAAMTGRGDRPLFLVDLAVPRDIDPLALEVGGVFLYNIDQLSELSQMNLDRRMTEAAACEELVREQVRQFASKLASLLSRRGATAAVRRPGGFFPECRPLIPDWIKALLNANTDPLGSSSQ